MSDSYKYNFELHPIYILGTVDEFRFGGSQKGFTGNFSTLFKQLVAKRKPNVTKYSVIIR